MIENQTNERELKVEKFIKYFSMCIYLPHVVNISLMIVLLLVNMIYIAIYFKYGYDESKGMNEVSSGSLITLSLLPTALHFFVIFGFAPLEVKSKCFNIIFAIIKQLYIIIYFSIFVRMAMLTLYYAKNINWKQYGFSGWTMWYNFFYNILLGYIIGFTGTCFNICITSENLNIDWDEKLKKCILKYYKPKDIDEENNVEIPLDEPSVVMKNVEME